MSIKYFNLESFHHDINGSVPVLVKYTAQWCNYCHNLTQPFHALADKYQDDFIMGEVNVDLYPALEQKAATEYLPTFILYQNGKELGRIVNPPNIGTVELFITEQIRTISDEELKAFETFQALIFS